ncbi:SanA/YdcF family protein [Streptomyces iconiensis]|uniref:ElyC/SanA/YdcF family protein n=1 Tax=Streptomyces iconiensis TaxID=1384038 RepID=A0ABT6ZQ67_9ACTN|nr:ElyC/SanA/YdcF family protein [Streptomyces iconiensis]MDJ1131205.1 ElyC/SanA/YdcF family protein [Streptomyces iconiensis]
MPRPQLFERARALLRRPRLPRTRRGRRRAVQGLVLLCVLALLPATWLRMTTRSAVTEAGAVAEAVAGAPSAPVAMVFGAGLWDGEPSPYLAHRLDTAAELYAHGKVRAVLVTGDNSRDSYDEPDAMRRYLTGRGVPSRHVVADYAGFDTWDSCARAKRVFGVGKALLVSQDFHIRRATALCGAVGIEAHGVPVSEPRDLTWYASSVRELPGAAKALYEATLTPDPHFLGPDEHGVRRALAK